MTDYKEEAYRLIDETILPKFVLTLFIGVSLGLASFLVLDSYEATPTDNINVSEFYNNNTKQCIDPQTLEDNGVNSTDYSEYVCKVEDNESDSANFSTIPENKSVNESG